jgi:phospholipase/carboxylesterase
MAHGRSDPVVPYALGELSADHLAGLGYALDWHEYAMPHSVCQQEIADIGHWLARHLKANPG